MAYKLPVCELIFGEERRLDFECKANLEEDDTIDSVTSLDVTPTTDPALVVGTPSVSGTRVQVLVSGGKRGQAYTFSGLAKTSENETLALEGLLIVR